MAYEPPSMKPTQPLPTTDKYGREVKVKKIVTKRRKKFSVAKGDNTVSPFERFKDFSGSKVTSF